MEHVVFLFAVVLFLVGIVVFAITDRYTKAEAISEIMMLLSIGMMVGLILF